MKKIREILSLKLESHYSNRMISGIVGVSSSTVSECLRRANLAGIGWPIEEGVDDTQLETLLYPSIKVTNDDRPSIDWSLVRRELQKRAVTMQLLWEEYKASHPDGISYSHYCRHYRHWREKRLDVWMHQEHKAGEKAFVDYSGMTMSVMNRETGELRKTEIFVITLGASSYTYVEATWSQKQEDFIGSHIRGFEYFCGIPEILVPDNLKSGVIKSNRYEPELNRSYEEMALHYGIAILPARARMPKDKSKVENAVQQVERHILAPLRDRIFFSLKELNDALWELLEQWNKRPFQKLPGSRLSQFKEIDSPALRALPEARYCYGEWKKARAGLDYHIELALHFYSVPYSYAKKELDVRYNGHTVEIFSKRERIASHVRSVVPHRHSTHYEHMPKSHQEQANWTPSRVTEYAGKIGPHTAELCAYIMRLRQHPQQGFRACLGIVRLAKSYGNTRVEASCVRALSIQSYSYKSIASILKTGLDQVPLAEEVTTHIPAVHEYVRGQEYFS